jgi:hypothetical protein
MQEDLGRQARMHTKQHNTTMTYHFRLTSPPNKAAPGKLNFAGFLDVGIDIG